MKHCPKCNKTYDDTWKICLRDEEPLFSNLEGVEASNQESGVGVTTNKLWNVFGVIILLGGLCVAGWWVSFTNTSFVIIRANWEQYPGPTFATVVFPWMVATVVAAGGLASYYFFFIRNKGFFSKIRFAALVILVLFLGIYLNAENNLNKKNAEIGLDALKIKAISAAKKYNGSYNSAAQIDRVLDLIESHHPQESKVFELTLPQASGNAKVEGYLVARKRLKNPLTDSGNTQQIRE